MTGKLTELKTPAIVSGLCVYTSSLFSLSFPLSLCPAYPRTSLIKKALYFRYNSVNLNFVLPCLPNFSKDFRLASVTHVIYTLLPSYTRIGNMVIHVTVCMVICNSWQSDSLHCPTCFIPCLLGVPANTKTFLWSLFGPKASAIARVKKTAFKTISFRMCTLLIPL